MADQQQQNSQQNLNGSGSTIQNLGGHQHYNTGNPQLDAIYYLADAISQNPQFTQNIHNAPHESQSNFSQGSNWKFSDRRNRKNSFNSSNGILSDIEDGIRDALLDELAGGDFKKGLQGALSAFTDKFGFELKELPKQYGRYLGRQLANTQVGKAFLKRVEGLAGNLMARFFGEETSQTMMHAFQEAASNAATNAASNVASNVASDVVSNAVGGALGGAAGGSQAAAAEQLFQNIGAGLKSFAGTGAAIAIFVVAMRPLFQGIWDFIKAWGKAFNKDEDMRRKRMENAQKRMQSDVESMVKQPFEILKKAAEEWQNVWDANLSTISLTQGYDKESVYALYSNIAEQLDMDGLSKVIPATDIVNNLGKILETGLSGYIAEAFAYESTWLSAAIPTEDFTGYAATYAQLASDAMNNGLSQADAVAYANTQLEAFASNLLYSSRTLSGGFTTGLKDAQSLFKDAVDIAQTAKTSNAAEISGTLTAVSGIIGSVAPDLAQGLVQNIVSAATGGNDSSIVALRSLAGINAGNTEFLRQMANDPQGVFTTIFQNLADMQNMSPTNYMEVAEGLSKVFGVDMKALARVDFRLLADKVSQMQVNTASLQENLDILQSGQATLSDDQLRYQEINNDILNNGLAYVIDSEYGRMIQEHMWEEQIADQLAENEYAVSLQGAALSLLEGLRHTVANILAFLNPLNYIRDGVQRIYAVDEERQANQKEIAALLEKTAVGSNATAFSNLTNTSGQDLHLVKTLAEMYDVAVERNEKHNTWENWALTAITPTAWAQIAIQGIASGYGLNPVGYGQALARGETADLVYSADSWNQSIDKVGGMDALYPGFLGMQSQTKFGAVPISRLSKYSGFSVGKSVLNSAGSWEANATSLATPLTNTRAAELAEQASKEQLQAFLDSAQSAAESGLGQAGWEAKAAEFGINNLDEALKDFGITAEELEGYYGKYQSGIAGAEEENRKKNIQDFIEENRGFWDYSSGTNGIYQTAMWIPFFGEGGKYDTRMNAVDTALTNIQTKLGSSEKHTVISGIEELSRKLGEDTSFTVLSVLGKIESDLSSTFVVESSNFQKCMRDWVRYMTESKDYTEKTSKASAWSELKQAEGDQQTNTMLALANAMKAFTDADLQTLDPQLQTNVLLGEIVLLLQTIMQQNNTPMTGMGLIDSISALGLGITTK